MEDYIKLKDCSFDDIYSFLDSSVEDPEEITVEYVGPLTFYIFDIREEKEWTWNAGTLVKVEYGVHRLTLDTHTRGWIGYKGP